MNKITIKSVTQEEVNIGRSEFKGWVKTHRQSKNVSFIELVDGTSVKGLQLVIEPNLPTYESIAAKITTGSSIVVKGELVESPAKGQKYELQVLEIELLGEADPETYKLQKKGHTLETLREYMHLRPRTSTHGAVFRTRSALAFAVHKFFQERNFYYVQTPIVTTSDCEGAGEMFQVTTLDLEKVPLEKDKVDYTQDFFKKQAHLTVSGQLEGEAFALALSNIYTFGPTFRAENSNTSRHLSEFWMIEPEMAFCDLSQDIKVAEEFIKYLVSYAFEHCAEDLDYLHKRDWVNKKLVNNLQSVIDTPAKVIEYTDAIEILEKSGKKFEFPVSWGIDLQAEHERFLTEQYIKGPVFVTNYPKNIKAFYMKLNDDDKTVTAMDLLTPGIGEIIGGAQREDREDVLAMRMREVGLVPEEYDWYLELRRYGGVPHAGFGLGFERLLMYITGIQNIRDVIAFPRYPGYGG